MPTGRREGSWTSAQSVYLGNEGECAFELLGHDNALNGEHKLGLIGDACWETRIQWASTDPGVYLS